MKKGLRALIVVILFLGAIVFGFTYSTRADEGGRKIVVFSSALNEPAKEHLIESVGGVKLKNLDLIGAKAVWLPSRAAEMKLMRQSGVVRIDDDVTVYALQFVRSKRNRTTQIPQVIPWGISRIQADSAWNLSRGSSVKVAIIDTGIDLKHPDLQANIKGGYNAVNPLKSPNDDNGHGTHVAGTVAALNNSIGVVGVAPEVWLYAVKVLRADGSGFLSDVIEGLDWAVRNGIQIANMSLGTASNVQAFHDAIKAAHSAGLIVVAAAGNSAGSVLYPAAYPETIAVSATDESDNLASFSSRGPEVDFAAPGVNIYSTYLKGTYRALSGTSMATPHVAGTAALLMALPVGTYDANSNGRWDFEELKARLKDSAQDLGDPGFDNLFGWGLVNAFSAVSF